MGVFGTVRYHGFNGDMDRERKLEENAKQKSTNGAYQLMNGCYEKSGE